MEKIVASIKAINASKATRINYLARYLYNRKGLTMQYATYTATYLLGY